VAFEVRLEHVGFLWKSDGSSVASIEPPHSGCSWRSQIGQNR